MATLPKLQDALEALKTAIQSALSTNGAPGRGQVYVGWPTATEETQKLGQSDVEGSVTVWPLGGRDATRYMGDFELLAAPQDDLVATVSLNAVTFSGTSDKSYNVHAFVAGHQVDAYYQTTVSEALGSIASGVAATINGLSLSGITATASGDRVTITGAQFQAVNIGSSGTIVSEQRRIRQMVQVTVWLNDFISRWQLVDIIVTNIGTAANHFLTLTDGSQAYIEYQSDHMDDSSESSYSLGAHHIVYMMEYGILETLTAYEIESVGATQQVNSGPKPTNYYP